MEENEWLRILNAIGDKTIELPTTPTTNAKPKWFKVETDGNEICVDAALNHEPASKISMVRILKEKEFLKILPYYYKRKAGEQVSRIVTDMTVNQVYYYSLIYHYIDN